MTGEKKLTFEVAMKELEVIIQKLDAGDVALEESILLYTRGMELSKYCREELDAVDKKISMISKDHNNETIQEEPFV